MKRQFIIGDIHGCYDELQELLDRASIAGDDEIIAVGDIVDRGPDSPRVLEYFRTHAAARALLGNHERKHVRSFQGLTPAALSQTLSRRQWGEAYPAAVAVMASFAPSLELDAAVVVHAFWEPGLSLADQSERVIVGTLQGEAYLNKTYNRPWYELYDGAKPLIVGHRDYLRTGQPFIYRDSVFCLDTGCYHGGALTGVVVPDFRIVSVPSRADYWAAARQAAGESDARDAATLSRLFDHLIAENDRALAALRAQGPFDDLSPGEQGKLYARQIGATPFARLLHRVRKGQLTRADLTYRYRTPEDVARVVSDMEMAHETIDDDTQQDVYLAQERGGDHWMSKRGMN